MNKNKQKEDKTFSKRLLMQESILLWIVTLAFLVLAFLCVIKSYFGELPWITAMAAFPWTTYGVSQAFYYNKSKKENTQGGIIYDTAMYNLQNQLIQNDEEHKPVG